MQSLFFPCMKERDKRLCSQGVHTKYRIEIVNSMTLSGEI